MKRDTYYDYIRTCAALLVFFTHKSDELPGGSIGAIVITMSWLTERFIEKPGIRFSKMVAKFRPAAASDRAVPARA